MLRINKILFPTDFSTCAEAAFAHAAHLARQYGAALHVLNVNVRALHAPDDPMDFLDLQQDAQNPGLLSDERAVLTKTAGKDVPVIHAQLQAAAPAEGILAYGSTHDVDLIVMGTHGRRGIDRLVLGSTAEEVVRLATVPVLTVPGAERKAPDPVVRRLLAPVDFSPFSRLAISYAKELAAAYGAPLDVLHVVSEPSFNSPFVPEADPVLLPTSAEWARQAKQALGDLVDQTEGADIKVQTFLITGSPAHEIVQFAAAQGADLIVMASHGRTGLKHWLLGSVTEKVVRSAPCPVFTIKSFGKSLLSPEARAAVARARQAVSG